MNAAVVGLGPIGLAIARALGPDLVAAADASAEARAAAGDLPVPIDAEAAASLRRMGGDGAAVLCTASRVPDLLPAVREALAAGLHVVSTCEELCWPWLRHRALADEIDAEARRAGRVVIGTGVNPGFVLDRLPVALLAVSARPRAVVCDRVVDLGTRREALRRKIGVGLSAEAWAEAAARGRLGHVGLGESAAIVAAGCGWDAGEVRQSLEPVPGDGGAVAGCRQTAEAAGGRVTLRLEMTLGARDPHDAIRIDGDPPVRVVVPGGVAGDQATVAAVLHALARLGRLAPGLRTVLDLV